MKLFATLLILFGLPLAALSQKKDTAAADTSKFSAALEAQIGCTERVDPAKAIRALWRSGVIARTAYGGADSISFYRVKRPLTVFGYRVTAVEAFDPKLPFERAPGTLPPILLGVFLPNPLKEVKTKLGYLESRNVTIDEQDDDPGVPRKSHRRTEIYCSRSN